MRKLWVTGKYPENLRFCADFEKFARHEDKQRWFGEENGHWFKLLRRKT